LNPYLKASLYRSDFVQQNEANHSNNKKTLQLKLFILALLSPSKKVFVLLESHHR